MQGSIRARDCAQSAVSRAPRRRSGFWRLIRLQIYRSGSPAYVVSGFFLLHIGTSLGTTHTKRVGAAMFQVSSLVS